MQTLYLNNSGSRWRNIGYGGESDRVAIRIDGVIVGNVAVDSYYAFGNWAGIEFRYYGKRYKRLPNDWDYSPEGFAIVDLVAGE